MRLSLSIEKVAKEDQSAERFRKTNVTYEVRQLKVT